MFPFQRLRGLPLFHISFTHRFQISSRSFSITPYEHKHMSKCSEFVREPPEDFDGPIFEFREEPLGLPADTSFGFFQGGPGDVLGPSGRYLIQAKLGYGVGANVWLAKDNEQGKHVALKILSGYTTQLNKEEKLRELICLQRLATLSPEKTSHCTRLLDHFYHPGIEEDGEHLCLALELEQTTLGSVWKANPNVKALPVPTVKHILKHVLKGLSAIHSCGIAHTDLKPDNIMTSIPNRLTTEFLDSWVTEHPPRVYPPTPSLNKTVTKAFVSETLPTPSVEDLIHCDFKLCDLSHAQIVHDETTDDVVPLSLRPPEVMLGGPWSEKIDIWTFGAMVFTFLTGSPLFVIHTMDHHRQYFREGVTGIETEDQTIEYLMWQITAFTGQRYPPLVLSVYPLSYRFFQKDGQLKSFNRYISRPVEMCMRDAGFDGSDEDVEGACKLIRRCLRLNPTDRPSAEELLKDPWLAS